MPCYAPQPRRDHRGLGGGVLAKAQYRYTLCGGLVGWRSRLHAGGQALVPARGDGLVEVRGSGQIPIEGR